MRGRKPLRQARAGSVNCFESEILSGRHADLSPFRSPLRLFKRAAQRRFFGLGNIDRCCLAIPASPLWPHANVQGRTLHQMCGRRVQFLLGRRHLRKFARAKHCGVSSCSGNDRAGDRPTGCRLRPSRRASRERATTGPYFVLGSGFH